MRWMRMMRIYHWHNSSRLHNLQQHGILPCAALQKTSRPTWRTIMKQFERCMTYFGKTSAHIGRCPKVKSNDSGDTLREFCTDMKQQTVTARPKDGRSYWVSCVVFAVRGHRYSRGPSERCTEPAPQPKHLTKMWLLHNPFLGKDI